MTDRGQLSFRVKLTLLGRAPLQSCRKLADSIQAPQGTRYWMGEGALVILSQRNRSQASYSQRRISALRDGETAIVGGMGVTIRVRGLNAVPKKMR